MRVNSRFLMVVALALLSGGAAVSAQANARTSSQTMVFDTIDLTNPDHATIQFDSQGADFGPWMSTFSPKVRRHWVIPDAAETQPDHVIVRLTVHKDGTLTDIEVVQPSTTASLNTSAVDALKAVGTALPLPSAYPVDSLRMTVVFNYNDNHNDHPPASLGRVPPPWVDSGLGLSGGAHMSPLTEVSLAFDAKGLDFGPWLEQFDPVVRHNWLVPQAAAAMSGHVVLRLHIRKNGALTDIEVVEPSSLASFNVAAVNALRTSNPGIPLPTAYPVDPMSMTVIFYCNER
jgi:TonB family protein